LVAIVVKRKALVIKIYDTKEFDSELLENFLKVIKGKTKTIPMKELKG